MKINTHWDTDGDHWDAPLPVHNIPPDPAKQVRGKKFYLAPGIGVMDLARKIGIVHKGIYEYFTKQSEYSEDGGIPNAICVICGWTRADLTQFRDRYAALHQEVLLRKKHRKALKRYSHNAAIIEAARRRKAAHAKDESQ